ncbi:tRNA (adenosine(37)-N6)-threonylcarbamoyltransferase complex ATPase subunit type 1 TsaE [Hyphococcus flavus]|uniref:tRNA threonylcarbamoyladenosine biosynthesis protein TsaE n=1 Tax=Hyphococcus flavus TaxID=1866326 RepID=A0AAE9ZCX7_9PROT|nr:tRNA (adenosine(37)-N6)-threonylcarbamoyltransferase complex ATPase subunit type 1 TsaE [Hyphococcus flavus]WDI32589.1 tRNA (adenosine(37)-N6)-threonylcarbamoyltransferase complex ATPase subunit type 1 TsaE [Hyphococcus flavus]
MTGILFHLASETETSALGVRLAPLLRAGDVVRLEGDLGAGKSTLARALIQELTGVVEAPSPTFTFVETYDAPDFTLWHFDFYRLEKSEDVWELGLEEALEDGAVLVEWPERAEGYLPEEALAIRLEIVVNGRQANIKVNRAWMARLAAAGIKSN